MISFFAKKKAEASSKNKLLFMSSFDENRFCFQIVKILSYFFLYCKDFFSLSCYSLVFLKVKGGAPARKYSSEAALSLRSRRNGTKFAEPVGSLIKCRRLPRGFFCNTSLPPLGCGCSNFEKWNSL